MARMILLFVLITIFYGSYSWAQDAAADKKIQKKLKGEWVIPQLMNDSVLTLIDHSQYKQDVFPVYNFLVFNENHHFVTGHSVGTFGCGTAAMDNLRLYNVRWDVVGGQLKLEGKYSDYTGAHKLDNLYTIERKGRHLILTRIN